MKSIKNQDKFYKDRSKRIKSFERNLKLKKISKDWIVESQKNKYVYNFDWLGRPIIQYPNDIHILQEIVWEVKPDVIIETGIAHGGSLILSASLLSMLDLAEYYKRKNINKIKKSNRKVIGVDIDIRPHNLKEIKKHPFYEKINLIEGSSVSIEVQKKIAKILKNNKKVLVLLDSMHTESHVLEELKIYSKFVSNGSYCIVYDTLVSMMPDKFYSNRPWGKKNNPMSAINKFIKMNKNFSIDTSLSTKLCISSCINGFLKKNEK